MIFRGIYSGHYVRKGCISFAWFYHKEGISELPSRVNFMFEPIEFGGYRATPISSLFTKISPHNEVAEMDVLGSVLAPTGLLQLLKEVKSRTVVLVGSFDSIEIYSPKAYKELRQMENASFSLTAKQKKAIIKSLGVCRP